MGIVYPKKAAVVVWSGGRQVLHEEQPWDADAPLVAERPELFADEPTFVYGRPRGQEAAEESTGEQEPPAGQEQTGEEESPVEEQPKTEEQQPAEDERPVERATRAPGEKRPVRPRRTRDRDAG